MLVKRYNPFEGEVVMDLPITKEQLKLYESGAGPVQNLFPHLSATEREFLISGLSPKMQEEVFGET